MLIRPSPPLSFKEKLKPRHGNLRLGSQPTASENKEKVLVPIPDLILKLNLGGNDRGRVILLVLHSPPQGCASWVRGEGALCSGFLKNILFGDLGEIIWKDYLYINTNMDILWSGKFLWSFTKIGDFEETCRALRNYTPKLPRVHVLRPWYC